MTWTLYLPIAPPSLNELKRGRNMRAQRTSYTKLRRVFAWALVVEARDAGVPFAEGKRRVHIVRLMRHGAKRYDPDNLIGGCKPLVDELVACRYLRDDSERYAEISYDQEPAEEHGTRIELEDV